jgi:hypothetical protein
MTYGARTTEATVLCEPSERAEVYTPSFPGFTKEVIKQMFDSVKVRPERPRIQAEFIEEFLNDVYDSDKATALWWKFENEFCMASLNDVPHGVQPWQIVEFCNSFFDTLETVEQILMDAGFKIDWRTE